MNRAGLVALGVLLGGCASAQRVGSDVTASAVLLNAQGAQVGTLTLEQHASNVRVEVSVRGLPAGEHGIHFHATGVCAAPDFTSAGGHFNPTQRQHGLQNPQGPHAGDLPNLTVMADGNGRLEVVTASISLSPGSTSLFDADGTAFVVHAATDDQRTDPSGNSGARIACGVVTRG